MKNSVIFFSKISPNQISFKRMSEVIDMQNLNQKQEKHFLNTGKILNNLYMTM